MLLQQHFCGYENIFEGFLMFRQFLNATDWQQTGHFPRVTLCDISIRMFAQDRQATVQCMLLNLL